MTALCSFSFSAPIPAPYRVAFVSDLHDRSGEDVLTLLRECAPDLICIGGDLLERHYHCVRTPEEQAEYEYYYLHNLSRGARALSHLLHSTYDLFHFLLPRTQENTRSGMAFLRQVVEIAPVCYSTGNHEWFLREEDREEIRSTGAILLENEDCEPLPGLHVGGLPTRHDTHWLEQFCGKDGFRLLICHHPEYYDWIIKGHQARTPDLILSGHAHGGQWRLFGRGLYAPGQGLLPRYTQGLYDGRLLVSAGAAQSSRLPRFGNPTDVILITLSPQQGQ